MFILDENDNDEGEERQRWGRRTTTMKEKSDGDEGEVSAMKEKNDDDEREQQRW